MTGKTTKFSTLKKIVRKAQTKSLNLALKSSAFRSIPQQNQKMHLEVQRRLTQIACGKALKKARITDPGLKAELHILAQRLAEEIATYKGAEQIRKADATVNKIGDRINNPIIEKLFVSALYENTKKMAERIKIDYANALLK